MTSVGVLAAAIAAGTVADRPRPRAPLTLGGYQVLAVDLHTHSSMWSDGALTPWGLVLEASRQGLDAIAITGHNEVLDGQLGRWFSQLAGGPLVLPGQEIYSPPRYHIIAVGIRERVSFRQSAANAIDEVHRQGGVAIAAHPGPEFWEGYDEAAMTRLDGAEVCHPLVFAYDEARIHFEQFAARAPVAAIGSSDYHGFGQMGACRTYVFARDRSEAAILDAIRERRTVVYGKDGRVYGDPELIRLAENDGRLRNDAPSLTFRGGVLDWFSRAAGVVGLAGLFLLGTYRPGLKTRPT